MQSLKRTPPPLTPSPLYSGLVIAMLTSLLFIILLRYLAGIMVWVMIALVILVIGYGELKNVTDLFCLCRSHLEVFTHSRGTSQKATLTNSACDVGSSVNNSIVYQVQIYFVSVFIPIKSKKCATRILPHKFNRCAFFLCSQSFFAAGTMKQLFPFPSSIMLLQIVLMNSTSIIFFE